MKTIRVIVLKAFKRHAAFYLQRCFTDLRLWGIRNIFCIFISRGSTKRGAKLLIHTPTIPEWFGTHVSENKVEIICIPLVLKTKFIPLHSVTMVYFHPDIGPLVYIKQKYRK